MNQSKLFAFSILLSIGAWGLGVCKTKNCKDQISFLPIIIIFYLTQRMISSSDVANYLHDIAENQRKLQYCRQILAENIHFTPHTLFNMNSSQNTTTLSKRQFIQIIKTIYHSNNHTQIQHIFAYFQIDAKNYLTLQEFTTLILPQTNHSLKNMVINRRANCQSLDYSLRYSLQKFFTQIIENQNRLEHYCKLKFAQRQNPKMKYRKMDLQNIKAFLASHGKFPNQNVLQTILKEIVMNKGIDRQNKIICEFILEYNETNTNCHKQNSQIKQNPNNQAKKINDNQKSKIKINESSRLSLLPRDKALQDVSKGVLNNLNINHSNSKHKNQANSGVDERIKTLMDSINIKSNNKNSESKVTIAKKLHKVPDSFQQKENAKVTQSKILLFKPEPQFSSIQISSIRRTKNELPSKQDYIDKRKFYQTSKLCSQENAEIKDKCVFKPSSRTITFSDDSKQNETTIIADLQVNRKNENAKRLQYLKSLVGQNANGKAAKQISTYRF